MSEHCSVVIPQRMTLSDPEDLFMFSSAETNEGTIALIFCLRALALDPFAKLEQDLATCIGELQKGWETDAIAKIHRAFTIASREHQPFEDLNYSVKAYLDGTITNVTFDSSGRQTLQLEKPIVKDAVSSRYEFRTYNVTDEFDVLFIAFNMYPHLAKVYLSKLLAFTSRDDCPLFKTIQDDVALASLSLS